MTNLLNKILILMIFCSIIIFLSGAKGNNVSQDLITIMEGAKYGDNLVFSGKGTMIYEHIYPYKYNNNDTLQKSMQGTSFIKNNKLLEEIPLCDAHEKSEIDFAFYNNKVYVKLFNFGERGKVPIFEWAFDGEKRTGIGYQITESGLIMSGGSIDNKTTIFPDKYDPRFSGMTIFSKPIGSLIEEAISDKNSTIKINGEEYINGFLCKIINISIYMYKYDKLDEFTLWLSHDCMYRPLKIEYKSPTSKIIFKIQYKRYSDNIFFPKLIIWDKYFKGNYTIHTVLTLNDDWVLNTYLPESLFEITFPKGFRVRDERIGKSYIVK